MIQQSPGPSSYQGTQSTVREAERLILRAVGGQDVGGVQYSPDEGANRKSLLGIASRFLPCDAFLLAVNNLLSQGKIVEDDGDTGEATLRLPSPDPEGMEGGGYFDEVVPLTTSREETASLPVGLGGSSDHEWDLYPDSWAIADGKLVI